MAQLDNIPAMLQSGEYVVRKEAVDKLGKDTMDMINNADRLGYMGGGLVPQGEHGHSAIDELLALNTLANQRSVDMTRGSAMMNKGGMAKKKMYGYENGGVVQKLLELARAKGSEMPQPTASIYDEGYSLPETDVGLEEPLSPSVFVDYSREPDSKATELNEWLSSGLVDSDGERVTAPGLLREIHEANKRAEMMEKSMKRQKALDYISPFLALAAPYGFAGLARYMKKQGYQQGGLGVQDKLAMAMDEFKDIEKMLSYATPSEYLMPKSQRDMLDLLQESGQVDVEKALEALDLIQRRYQEGSVGFHMPRYQNGGVASYQDGGYSPSDSIQQYYETFGYEPTDEKTKKQFEELYAYNPSEALGDIGELRTDISRQLGTATTDTASYGRGFGAFGGRQRSMGDIRRRAEETYGTGVTDIMETSREASEADALQFLAGLQQSDADMRQFTVDPEDNPVSELPTTNQGPVFYNGSTWIWSEEEGQYVQS